MAWLRRSSHGIHGIHRSFVASVLPRNSRNCTDGLVASVLPRNSQNSQKFYCVGTPTEFTEFTEVLLRRYFHGIHRIHRSFVASVLPRNSRNSQKFGGAVGCVGMAGCHTLLICAHPCASVRICGRLFSARNFCAFRGFFGYLVSHGLHRFAQMAWLRLFFHGIHRIHRSFGVLLAAWVWQDAIPS